MIYVNFTEGKIFILRNQPFRRWSPTHPPPIQFVITSSLELLLVETTYPPCNISSSSISNTILLSQLWKLLFPLLCVHSQKLCFNKTNSLPGFLKPQQKGCQKLHSSINCLVFVSAKQQKTRKWSFGVCFNCWLKENVQRKKKELLSGNIVPFLKRKKNICLVWKTRFFFLACCLSQLLTDKLKAVLLFFFLFNLVSRFICLSQPPLFGFWQKATLLLTKR